MISVRLEKLVDDYILLKHGKIDKELVRFSKEKISEEIESEVKEAYYEELKERAESEIESSKIKDRIKNTKSLILNGIFGAFLVGMIVNQLTDLLTFLKNKTNWGIGITLVALGVFSLILFFWVVVGVLSVIEKLLKNKDGD